MEGQTLFSVRATLAVSADSERSAHRIASDALRTLADVAGIEHAAVDVRCGLFDSHAFAQIPGQLAISDSAGGPAPGGSGPAAEGEILDILDDLGTEPS